MAYNKTNWQDHIVVDGEIVQQGTPISATNMNKIEQGIESANANDSATDTIIGKRTIENPTIDVGTSNDFITNLFNLFTTAIRAIRTSLSTHTISGGHAWDKITGKPVDATITVAGFMSAADKTTVNNVASKINDVNVVATTAGTGAAYTVNITPAPVAYYDGMTIVTKIHTTNTSSIATLKVNSLAAIYIKRFTSVGYASSLKVNMLYTGLVYTFTYTSSSNSWVVRELTQPSFDDIIGVPQYLNNNIFKIFPSNDVRYSDTNSFTGNSTTHVKHFKVKINHSGSVNVNVDHRRTVGAIPSYLQIFVNDIAVGSSYGNGSTVLQTQTFEVTGLYPGDIISVGVINDAGGGYQVANFKICGSNYEKIS